jgi:hypothetical protein
MTLCFTTYYKMFFEKFLIFSTAALHHSLKDIWWKFDTGAFGI